jgi:dTDP-4-amino-4,6-dideoxygalactose transaminase
MINLFNIPNHQINTSDFNHYLHGDICKEFENNFCEYVGAKYSCTVNSATSAIYLALLDKNTTVNVPSMIPPVVCNAILTSGNKLNFTDDTDWVGNSYILHEFEDYKIIDSAQKVDSNQFVKEANDGDLMIFSFYPTKPIGSSDGGIVVSNDYEKIRWFKEATMNGMTYAHNNWDRTIKFPGYKMYMNSIQCYIANENLKLLDFKKMKLSSIREKYNKAFGYNNTSDHLYRIEVSNRDEFIKNMRGQSIICGVHYDALHENKVYGAVSEEHENSSRISRRTVSIPYHEALDINGQVEFIIKNVKRYSNGTI